jgi:hypothetical protein
MDRLKQRRVPITMLVRLLVARGVRVSGAKTLGDGLKTRMQGSTLPLNSMDGLELQGISEPARGPIPIGAELPSLRLALDGGL